MDLNEVLGGVDLNALLGRLDMAALLAQIDLDAVLADVDLDALLTKVDLGALLARLDLNEVLANVDLNRLLANIDMVAIAERAEIGRIVSESSQQVAGSALDLARRQVVGLDVLVTRIAGRVFRRNRRGESDAPLTLRPSGEVIA